MGIYASYYAITESQANEYKELLANQSDESVEKFFESLDELDENDACSEERYVDLDKLWDGLHFLLTGFASYDDDESIKTPAQNALYDGFFGQECLSADGIHLTDNNRLADIVQALECIDIDELLDKADFDDFTEADLYPAIWHNEDKDEFLADALKEYFENFKQFYQNALKNNHSVLITIC